MHFADVWENRAIEEDGDKRALLQNVKTPFFEHCHHDLLYPCFVRQAIAFEQRFPDDGTNLD